MSEFKMPEINASVIVKATPKLVVLSLMDANNKLLGETTYTDDEAFALYIRFASYMMEDI